MAHILFIDDNLDVQKLLHVALKRKKQHELTLASNGEEGLALAANQKFDLVLLDIMMPDMDGYEVARRLRAEPRTQHIPIIMFTSRAQTADAEAGIEAGANAYLSKLASVDDVLKTMDEVIAESRSKQSAPAPTSAAPPPTQPAAPAPESVATAPLPPPGRSVCILGCRGGVGATMLAVNIAAAFTRRSRQVCLIDLWHVSGHAAPMMRLPSKPSWGDLNSDLNPKAIGSALIKHPSGMRVLAAPAQPQSVGLSAEAFTSITKILPTFFNEVIFNASPSLDAATRMALTYSERILLVLAPEVTTVPAAAAMLGFINSLNVPSHRVRVVLNQPAQNSSAPLPAIERELNHPIDAILPYDLSQPRALAQGIPLAFSPTTSTVPPYLAGLAMLLHKI
ncbi:MAG: response regulator [Chloroflexi bacterium]|nr:response regulator [Chloroflexota bacterium]